MLNAFPHLLVYSFFAPTLLRLAVGAVYICIAWHTWSRAEHLGRVPLPIVGAQAWLPYLAGLAEAIVALMFLVGWYTQVAALVSIIAAIKCAIYKRFWPHVASEYYPLGGWTVFLVFVISLSLLLSGGGALGFDLPL